MPIQAVDNIQIVEKSPVSNENPSIATTTGTEDAESSSGMMEVTDLIIWYKVSDCWCGVVMRRREFWFRQTYQGREIWISFNFCSYL